MRSSLDPDGEGLLKEYRDHNLISTVSNDIHVIQIIIIVHTFECSSFEDEDHLDHQA